MPIEHGVFRMPDVQIRCSTDPMLLTAVSIAHGLQDASLLCSDKILLRIATAMGITTVQP